MYNNYAITITETAPGLFTGTSRDFADIKVTGKSLDEVLEKAPEAIESAVSNLVEKRILFPVASEPEDGDHLVRLSAVTVGKMAIWWEVIVRNLSKADIYKQMNIVPAQLDRIMDFAYPSKMPSLEAALKALNTSIRVTAQDDQWVELAHGGFFVRRLVDAYVAAGVREMPIGKTREGLTSVKPYSLDFILRTRYARQPDTMQAVDTVLDSLEATGLFRRSLMNDPKTNREVESMALV